MRISVCTLHCVIIFYITSFIPLLMHFQYRKAASQICAGVALLLLSGLVSQHCQMRNSSLRITVTKLPCQITFKDRTLLQGTSLAVDEWIFPGDNTAIIPHVNTGLVSPSLTTRRWLLMGQEVLRPGESLPESSADTFFS
jgi:hypothetical protein